ncbi:hypothetical protein STAS_29652 [Striga asiatica]|uniref:Uncharacterized protein n=1 Tax=Striga asiatica TaxID=4170 RepID=A0A5A7R3H3_STRAF|nr:hypothetical protein STAS_29652 [Striga asiatica]
MKTYPHRRHRFTHNTHPLSDRRRRCVGPPRSAASEHRHCKAVADSDIIGEFSGRRGILNTGESFFEATLGGPPVAVATALSVDGDGMFDETDGLRVAGHQTRIDNGGWLDLAMAVCGIRAATDGGWLDLVMARRLWVMSEMAGGGFGLECHRLWPCLGFENPNKL